VDIRVTQVHKSRGLKSYSEYSPTIIGAPKFALKTHEFQTLCWGQGRLSASDSLNKVETNLIH